MGRKLTNYEFQNRLKQLREFGLDVHTNDEYISSNDSMIFYCSENHKWQSIVTNVLNKHSGCPYCSGRLPIIGVTDLWTTRPDIAAMLFDQTEGYNLKENSHVKTNFVCPDCQTVLNNKIVKNVAKRGLQCSVCGDGVSYPNKFARAILKQANVSNVEYEWQPDWLKPYFYDNYFEYDNQKYVLEMDGGIGHGNVTYKMQVPDIDGLARDKYKDNLAKQNGVFVIRIDCNYANNDRFQYIKHNILNSCLSNVIDFNQIDFDFCNKMAQKSMVYLVSNMYNSGMSIKEIIANSGYAHTTIYNWLKQAVNIGICSYNALESKQRSRLLVQKAINQYDKSGNFIAWYESQKSAEKITGIKCNMINAVLKGNKRSAGGFEWFYADDQSQPDKTKVVFNNIKLIKEVI